ncbi:MAG: hypothetical protein RBJ76_17345 [Stenomitos frigidus ULC029]
MTQSKLEAALNAAFNQCAAALQPLSDRQKQILLQVVLATMQFEREGQQPERERRATADDANDISNPLEQLTIDEKQAFLSFLQQQENQNQSWKITLLNDWLAGKSSGTVQFIRERYGIQWLEQITPEQVAAYLGSNSSDGLKLKVGDRIEITNGLWEWVQENGPCSREWFPCTVVSLQDTKESSDVDSALDGGIDAASSPETGCVIRFGDGTEYEIQGIYSWNRPNWRWLDG